MEGHSQPPSPARGRKNSSTLGTFLAKINKDRGGKKDGIHNTPESYRRAQSASDLSGYMNSISQRSPTQNRDRNGGSLDEIDQDEVIAQLVAAKKQKRLERKGSKKTRPKHEEEMEDDEETMGPSARRCASASHLSSWDETEEGEESDEEGGGEEGVVNAFSDLVANHKTLQSVILRQGSLALPSTPSPSYFRRTAMETEKEREIEKERERNRKEHQDKAEIYRGLLRLLFYRGRVFPLLRDVVVKGIKSMAHGNPCSLSHTR